jgi:hypothetical protein
MFHGAFCSPGKTGNQNCSGVQQVMVEMNMGTARSMYRARYSLLSFSRDYASSVKLNSRIRASIRGSMLCTIPMRTRRNGKT